MKNLKHKLIASGVFALAAASCHFSIDLLLDEDYPLDFLPFVVGSALLVGYTFGARILDRTRIKTLLQATTFAIVTGILSFILFSTIGAIIWPIMDTGHPTANFFADVGVRLLFGLRYSWFFVFLWSSIAGVILYQIRNKLQANVVGAA